MSKKDSTIVRKMLSASIEGTVNRSSFNADTNEVEVVFATENPVLTYIGGERVYEVLDCSGAACELERLNAGGPVLDSHNDWSLDSQFGTVVRAWMDATTKEGKAILRLSKTEADKNKVEKIKDGIHTNISVRARRKQMMDTGIMKDGVPIYRTMLWEPQEISFVTVPGDHGSRVKRDAGQGDENEVTIFQHIKNSEMTEAEKAARKAVIDQVCRGLQLGDDYAMALVADESVTEDIARSRAIEEFARRQAKPDADEAAKKAAKAATERAIGISDLCRKLNLDGEYAKGLIADETITLDIARSMAIDKAAEMQNQQLGNLGGQHTASLKPDAERELKRAQAKEHAIMQRAGIVLLDDNGSPVKYDPDVYRGMTLMEIANEGLIERGMNPRTMSVQEKKQWLLNPEAAIIRSAGQMTTSDFPAITENVLNKFGLQRYMLAERTWEPLVKRRTVRDFKPISNVRMNDVVVDETSEILEGGEYTQVKMTDGKESYKITKYGKKAVLSWEALIT
jgi:hypothetical protein